MGEVGGMLASAILKVVTQQIGSAIGGQIRLQWDFSEDLNNMKMMLESIVAVLKDAEWRSIKDEAVRLWLKRLTNATLDVSDMLDELEAGTKPAGSKLSRFTILTRFTMANKMRKMRKQLEEITNQHQGFSFKSDSTSNVQLVIHKRETDSRKVEVVGRTEEQLKILASLSNMTNQIIILPLYGIGGIGKTTLARWVFNSTQFKDYCKVWVYVSQVFDYIKIGNSIISQVSSSNEQSQINEKQMIWNRLIKLLANKKILIILDDIWEKDTSQLEELKDLLKVGEGSKVVVIVTTRDQAIANQINTVEPCKIEPLTNDVCWTIMKQKCEFEARPDKGLVELELTGKAIAEKCGGLALAAQSVGYMLKSMSLDQWVSVKKNDIWNVFSSTDAYSPQHVPTSLKLSYSNMPPHLKLCFAYCAVFPKGKTICKDDLIYQWISLGFIEPDSVWSIWQLGEKYVSHLLGMSFLQHRQSPITTGAYHKDVTLFEMHDLVHDLAKSVLVDEILDAKKEGNTRGSSFRYALLPDCSKPLEAWTDSPHKIRAMHFLDCRKIELHTAAISSAKSLRVLDLSECCIQKLPDSISKLKQLRYLKAPRIKDKKIPNSITKLSKLKYLILHGSSAILGLPESIGEMKDLIHLDLSGCSGIENLPESIGEMKDLIHLDLSGCSRIDKLPESIGEMKDLMHLDLSGCSRIDKLPESIGGTENLLYLDLSGCSGIKKLPKSSRKLKSLVHLDLSNCTSFREGETFGGLTKLQYLSLRGCFRFQGLVFIENLTQLRYLNLSEVIYAHHRILITFAPLCNLEHLDLSGNIELRELPECLGSLRKLHTLDLTGCRCLREVPKSICDIGSLKILIVKDCYQMRSSSELHFEVHAGDGELSSNLVLLKDAYPTNILKIDGLEHVKSTEEVEIIKLKEKRTVIQLRLEWTRDAKGFVEDIELLGHLVPPMTLNNFDLRGYNSIKFPTWVMCIAVHLPILTKITMFNLPKCNSLPPLGQLPKLRELVIRKMDSVTKIDMEFYGSARGFPQLNDFCLIEMEGLEEWTTTMSDASDGANTSMFPALEALTIRDCPKLKLKPCPPRDKHWKIENSDNVISSWEERGQTCASSSVSRTYLRVKSCKVPLHQWRLLHHLPALTRLSMEHCSDLTNSTAVIIQELSTLQSLSLQNIDEQELPKWLAELTSLKELDIRYCRVIKSLPDSLQALTKLEELYIYGCPELKRWCELEENKRNLARINISIADDTNKLYRAVSSTQNNVPWFPSLGRNDFG